MIAIADYGVGNLGSILNMLRKIGVQAIISSRPAEISAADKVILPGVGAFDAGVENLRRSGLMEPLQEKVLGQRAPCLGICLGMQLLMEGSEEGVEPGLGWIRGHARRFAFDAQHADYKVPHMGWNTVALKRSDPLFRDLDEEARFYFVHSYHVVCEDAADVTATSHYGYDFTCGLHRGNIFGAQFHPEKSHRFGMQLLKNFASLH